MSDREEIDCKTCGERKQKYQDCPGKPWYTVGDIRWCYHQVLWMIDWFFDTGKDGVIIKKDTDTKGKDTGVPSYLYWADSNPDKSTDVDMPSVQRIRRAGAYFEGVCCVTAELMVRLKRAGESGEKLVAELRAGKEGDLTYEADMAFHYITGVRRKREPFYKWKCDRKRRQNRHLSAKNPPVYGGKSKLVSKT